MPLFYLFFIFIFVGLEKATKRNFSIIAGSSGTDKYKSHYSYGNYVYSQQQRWR